MDDTHRELEQLRAKCRVFEEENSLLSERAEETLLLSLVSEVISTSNSAAELIPRVLERISVLKDVCYCSCVRISGSEIHPISHYCQECNAPAPDEPVTLPLNVLRQMHESPVVYGPDERASNCIPASLFCISPEPRSIAFLPFDCRDIPNGVVILADDQRSPEELSALLPLAQHILQMMISRLDNLSLLTSLTELNARLDQRVEERTREAVQREVQYRTLFESIPDGVFLVEVEGRPGTIVATNQAGASMHGYFRDDLVGKPMEILCECYAGDLLGKIIDLLRHQPTLTGQSMHRRSDGSEFPSETVERLLVIDQKPYLLSFHRDITERHRAEELIRLNERRLQSAQAMAHAGNWELDLTTKKMWGSEEAFRIYGLERSTEYLPLIQVQSQVSEEFRPQLNQALQQLILHGTEYNVEFEICRADDGSPRWVHSRAERLLSTSGIPTHVVGVLQDITERKRSEELIQESEERYRRLVEFSPDAIVVHREGRFVYVNPAGLRMLGASQVSQLLGKPVLEIIHPADQEKVQQRLFSTSPEGVALPVVEERLIRLDGTEADVEVATLPISYQGAPAMLVVARDISEQKRLQAQLAQSQKIQSIGTLAAGIAHDFNNILNIIMGYASLLVSDPDDETKRVNRLIAINQAVERGAALVKQILVFARQTHSENVPMEVEPVIRDLLGMLVQTFPKTILFREQYADDTPTILADKTQIHQAVLNLCVNARDAMPEGGTISARTSVVDQQFLAQRFSGTDSPAYLCIEIADTGLGMDEATRKRVFDPFFTTKEKGKGTGLGLSVVYGIMQTHRGFIDIDSTVGVGTTFRLYLPAIMDRTASTGTAHDVAVTNTEGAEAILIVEDEPLVLEMIRVFLETNGYRVLSAKDGLEAVAVFHEHQEEIDLVVTDVGLPKLSGKDVVHRIRELDSQVRILVASGFLDVDERDQLQRAGISGIIQKPYSPQDFLKAIRRALDMHNA